MVSGQFVRFAVVGACNTALTLGLYTLLLAAGLHYLQAFAPAFAAGAVCGYTLNRVWTFDATRPRRRGLARYVSVQIGGLALNAIVLVALVEGLAVDRIVAQAIAIATVSMLTFAATRAWVFGDPRRPAATASDDEQWPPPSG